MGIDFSKFSAGFKAKFEAAAKDKEISPEEFKSFSKAEQDLLISIFRSDPNAAGDIAVYSEAYQQGDSTVFIRAGQEGATEGKVTLKGKVTEKYPNASYGYLKEGFVTLYDKQGEVIKDIFGNPVKFKHDNMLKSVSGAENVAGSFEVIEGEPAERTNRRFAVALIKAEYNSVIRDLQNIVLQMGVLDAGLWREALGMGVQVIADLKENQKTITATTKKKIERIETDRDRVCNTLTELIDSPADFEAKFYQLVGKDYRDNAFEELRDIQHNQENKDAEIKFKECSARFNELYAGSNITKEIESWQNSVEFQQQIDGILNIVVMLVMTGGIGELFQGSVQALAKNILKAAAKGDMKAVMANFAKLAPEVQTVYSSVAKREFGVAAAQVVTPMASSAATMSSWEGLKAFVNGATNGEELSGEDLLKRTLAGIASGAEMGAMMGAMETFAIAPVMVKLTPFLNKLSGASAEISNMLGKGNGTVSMEKIMETYSKTSETLRGKIAKEGLHAVVALPVYTVGFTASDGLLHYNEEEYKNSLLEKAVKDEEREAINNMSPEELRIAFIKDNFIGQVKGMATIEGVGLIFRRLQAGRIAAKSLQTGRAPDIIGANLRKTNKNGKTVYEICSSDGKVIPVKTGNKSVTEFSSIEHATAAYSAMCIELYSKVMNALSEQVHQAEKPVKHNAADGYTQHSFIDTRPTMLSSPDYSPEAFESLIADLNQKYENANKMGIDIYPEDAKQKMQELYQRNPKLVMDILNTQLKLGGETVEKSFNVSQMENLIELQENYPQIFNKMPIFAANGNIRAKISSANDFIKAYQINPELTERLANSSYARESDNSRSRFGYKGLLKVVENYEKNDVLRRAVEAKVYLPDGTEDYAFDYTQIYHDVIDPRISAFDQARVLNSLTTADGKYRLFPGYVTDKMNYITLDGVIEDLENPEKANDARKILMLFGCEAVSKKQGDVANEALFDSNVQEYLCERIPDDVYALEFGQMYQQGNYELRVTTKEGTNVLRFRYDESSGLIDEISKEEVIQQNEKQTTVRTEFSDGRSIVETVEYTPESLNGYQRKIAIANKRTMYDVEGEPVYEEIIKPSKASEGNFDATTADRINGVQNSSETRITEEGEKGTTPVRKLKSVNGSSTETSTSYKDGSTETSYIIKNPDGKVALNIQRQNLRIDENNYMSTISTEIDGVKSNQKYNVKFEPDKITVTREGQRNNPPETVTLDRKNIDDGLINVLKQLPADYLFAMKKMGVEYIRLSYTADNANNAFFMAEGKIGVTISPELMKNPFVFAHELGHGMDYLLCGNLHDDPKLLEIFKKELQAMKENSSDTEGRIIDYFTRQNAESSSASLSEIIAETNALLSGMKNNSNLVALRGFKLQQNFPETMKYISEKLTDAYNGKIIEVKPEERQAAIRGIVEIPRETITIGEKRVKTTPDVSNELTPETIEEKGLGEKSWEEKAAEYEAERKIRVAALDKMTLYVMNNDCKKIEKDIYDLSPIDKEVLMYIKNYVLPNAEIREDERNYLTTLVENRLNPPTFENYTPEQIAAEAELIVNHFYDYEKSITQEVKESGLNRNKYFNPRIKSDTSTYDKIYNYLKNKSEEGATLTEAIKDVRDGYGMRGDIEKGDFSSIPEVRAKLDWANEKGITPSERRTRLIDAARKAAEFQSEPLLESLKEQIIAQATSEKGLKGVRIMNYVSVDGIPMMSEDQLWDLRQFAIECGVSANHIKLIEIEEYINDKGQPAQRPIVAPFSEKGIGSRKYTSKAQNGYTSFQMNFETKDGDWIEFQSSDEITRAFANFEHLIYDTMTGKDIVGRHGKTRPIYNQLLQTIDKTNMSPKILEAYRKTYITDYYTYCRAKSLGIELGEPRLEDYGKMIGKQLGIPDLKLDRRLDAKNLEALQSTADLVKQNKYDEVEGTIVYNLLMDLTPLKRGEASKESFEEAKHEFRKELANYYSEESLENMTEWFNELSQEDLAAKIEMFIHVKNDLPADLPKDKLGWFGLDDIKANNLADAKKVYDGLNNILPETEERFVTAAQVEPGAGKAAIALCRKTAERYGSNGKIFTDLIPMISKENLEHMSEVFDMLPKEMDYRDARDYLENIDIIYKPLKELENKGVDISSLPLVSIKTNTIAENYDFVREITDKYGNADVNQIYELFRNTPESKKTELKDKIIDLYGKEYNIIEITEECNKHILKWVLETDCYNSTPQELEENKALIQSCRGELSSKYGYTFNELNDCTVEKLLLLYKISSLENKQPSKEEREYYLNLNLEKRYFVIHNAPMFLKNKILTCTDSEYENIVQQFRERPRALTFGLTEDTVNKLLSISKERYDKIDRIISQSGRNGGERFITMLLELSGKGLDNALKRPELFEGNNARNLTYKQRGELFELDDAEYNKLRTPISERNTEGDINPEEYRAEIRAKLDGSYTLDMSAYEHSRAKKAAEFARNDNRTVVAFDEKAALKPGTKKTSDGLPNTKDLLNKLESKGSVTLSIPVKNTLNPKGNETNGKAPTESECGEFPTDITLHFGEARAWDNSRFARDMLQNFYDGNGHTLEGVDIKITKENGRYKVKISGKGIYDFQQVWTMGLNDHNSGDAGKYGEGMKVMFSTLLESRGTTKVTHSSGDWVVELKAEEGKSKSRTLIMGDLQKAEKRQEGASIEFDTTDAELVKEILNAKDYFYSPYNPDFKDMSYENEYFGIKLLPKGEKGNVYLVQRYEVKNKENSTLDDSIEGMTLVFKVMPNDDAIENNPHNRYSKFELETGRNRTPLTQGEITKLVMRYAMSIPDEQLIRIIGSMKDVYLTNPKMVHKSAYILEGFTTAALIRGLKIDFGHDRYVAYRYGTSEEMIKFAQMSGKTVVAEQMSATGVESIADYFTKSKKDVLPEANPTEVQANKLKLVDEAVKLFADNLDLENINVVTKKEASNPRYLYDKPKRDESSTEAAEAITGSGNSYGMWVDKKYLNLPGYDLFEYMATWLHEISHKVDGDGKDPFNARLEKLIELSTEMCRKDPAFRTKLRVLNEEFRKLNKQNTPDLTQELNTEEFKAQMEQNLRWLTEDPELPEAEERDTRRGISILSNDKSPTTLDYVANQADKYKRKAEAWAERTLSDNPDSWLSKTLDKADKLWNKAAVELGFKAPKVEEITWVMDLSYDDIVKTKEERTSKKNTTEFEYKPQSEPQRTVTGGRTTGGLLSELENEGRISYKMPPLADREPKIEDTGFEEEKDRIRFKEGKTVRSNTVLRYNSTNAWSLEKIARDLFQNMYDGHRGTLDGIKIDVEQTPEGNYRVKISGQSEYNWFHIENWGASGEENLGDGTRGGGFGEGAKMVPIHLLHEKYVNKYTYASGEWSIDFTREKDENGIEKPVNEGYLMRTPHLNEERVNGNYVEFETSNRDVVEAILNARNYFKHSENPDFINNDVDSKDIAFTVLPKGEKGNFYYNQRFGVKTDKGSTGFENPLEEIRIILKRSLSDEELQDIKITKDNDRNGLDKWDIYKIVFKLAKSMTNEELMDAINKLERFWTYERIPEYSNIDYTFEQQFTQGLIYASYGLKFDNAEDLKIVCIDSQDYEPLKAAALKERGYKIADPNMQYLGFPTINEVYDKVTKIEPLKSSKLTIQEQEKIRLLEEAMGVNTTDEKNGFQANIVVFDRTEYQNGVEFYTQDLGENSQIKFPYLAIDRAFLRSNDFMTCYNTLISRLRWAQSDTKASYGYSLTNLLNSQLQQLSLPQNAEKLRLIEERYEKISDL